MRFGKRNPWCRKSGYARETIPHVLNHCKPHSEDWKRVNERVTVRFYGARAKVCDVWKKRHDAVQNRVARAIPSSVGSVSIDFTVAFEDRYESLASARQSE
ncbi:hypothetical protein NPIL_202391 [Nephila pilipes]|uniref:Uncharacterized protein n=1 Tax=Nephila pilipes TaxID=299642 RepID=A0A8X6KP15_NEPPI|nr:hypothetical protein NPIL_202391 [Nephila pilipes]